MKRNLFLVCFFQVLITVAQTATFNANGTFVVPEGITTITVKAWGGGGAGGGSDNTGLNQTANGASGGGGAGYATGNLTVVSGTTIPVVVGLGGVGVTNGDGGDGTDSFLIGFETKLKANGGKGGQRYTGKGGAGGTFEGNSIIVASSKAGKAAGNGVVGSGSTTPSKDGGNGLLWETLN